MFPVSFPDRVYVGLVIISAVLFYSLEVKKAVLFVVGDFVVAGVFPAGGGGGEVEVAHVVTEFCGLEGGVEVSAVD